MTQGRLALLILVLFAALVGSQSVFTVHQTERAILAQLGEIKRSDFEPGFHLKLPFFQNVLKFDGRIQSLDSEPQLFLTSEKKNVKVDSFVKWRIRDVARYFTTNDGSEARAAQRLSEVVQKRLKDEFSTRSIADVVSGERADIMKIATEELSEYARNLGIEIVDVRIKRIDLPDEVSSSVFQRMEAERTEVAKQFRSRGEEEAKVIRARAEREREVLLAEGNKDAEQTRGEGDASAAEIYALAYSQDAEFYALYRSLSAYRASFGGNSDVLLMKPDSEFFRYFKDPSGNRRP
ncbi:MAG: protease modulator HflC [Pseudomonadota bacterium]